eukprot:scaffold16502_cov63-Phaeocystis_antarctica.AAC.2
MEFTVEWGDTSYNITVPDGVGAGQLLMIELPALGEETGATHPTGGMQPVEIVVPDGCTPGMEFTVEWGGVSYSIAVPEGVWPGQPLTIELPELPAEPALGVPSIQEEEEEDRVPEAAGEHYVGKEIKVLRSNGEYGPATVGQQDQKALRQKARARNSPPGKVPLLAVAHVVHIPLKRPARLLRAALGA